MEPVKIIELEDVDGILPWRERWDALARDTGQLVFQSSAWLSAWWTILEPEADLTLILQENGDDLDGALAMSRLRRRFHWRMPASVAYLGVAGSGVGAADRLGPMARTPSIASALVRATEDVADGLPIVFPNVSRHSQPIIEQVPGMRVVNSTEGPSVDLSGLAEVGKLWSPSRRGDIRRCLRRCADIGLRRRWVRYDGVGEGAAEFDQLIHLHRLLWNWRGREGVLGSRKQRLLADVSRRLAATGSDAAWIQTIEGDDETVAAMLTFQFGSTMCSYATGWNPAFRKLGLGILLEAGGLEAAHERGLDRYDFLRGTELHKVELGGVIETDITYCLPTGVMGRALFGRDRLLEHHRPAWQAGRVAPSTASVLMT